MTSGAAASLLGHAQIAGIYKLDVIHVFFQPLGVGASGIGGGSGVLRETRPRMGLLSSFEVLRRSLVRAGRQRDVGISSMAVGATQTHSSGGVHGRAVHRVVATYATD